MGTIVQRAGLSEDDFRRGVPSLESSQLQLKGDNDLLNLTRPDVIKKIHLDYAAAGADIITTNTFASTSIAQEDWRELPSPARPQTRLLRKPGARFLWRAR